MKKYKIEVKRLSIDDVIYEESEVVTESQLRGKKDVLLRAKWISALDAESVDESETEEEIDWHDLTKKELDEYAKSKGIDLDARNTKVKMQEDFEKALAE